MNILKFWRLPFVQTEVKPAEQQVGKLKLSDAIRIGAKIRPQCFGYLFKNGGSCALGAAFEGLYGYPLPEGSGFDTALMDKGGEWFYFIHPSYEIFDEIVRRNDQYGQTREQIADYLESIGR